MKKLVVLTSGDDIGRICDVIKDLNSNSYAVVVCGYGKNRWIKKIPLTRNNHRKAMWIEYPFYYLYKMFRDTLEDTF